ncbi:MAG: 3-deoxy-7-phosphoheptulonate synthase [Actinomycetota bacterium]
MLLVMRPDATQAEIDHVLETISTNGLHADISVGKYRTIIGAVGNEEILVDVAFEAMPGVERLIPVMRPYKFVAKEVQPEGSTIKVGSALVGPGQLTLIAGPCSVETEEQALVSAHAVRDAGATILRGGAFKPRTSPYAFQGLGERGLDLLVECKRQTGLPVVTEVLDARDLERISEVADCLQIGARNMQNFLLLREVGMQQLPVLLKRGFCNTIEELLMSAEYIAKGGNDQIILCERGIRTFEPETRATLDFAALTVVKQLSHLPIVVDPSHAAGRADLVLRLSLGAVAAGADGLMIEVHPNPSQALSDGAQAMPLAEFEGFARHVALVRKAVQDIDR